MTKDMINGYSYRITQASKSELVVITFEIIRDYIVDAMKAFSHEDKDSFRDNIKMARRSLNVLMTSLDMKYEISANLMILYRYMNLSLQKASMRLETTELDAILTMLDKLKNSFLEVSRQDESGPLMKNTQTVYAGLTYSNSGVNNEIFKDQGSRRGFMV